MHCKTLWLKQSVKCISVEYINLYYINTSVYITILLWLINVLFVLSERVSSVC